MSEEGYLTSTDVKQFIFCPKIIYFQYVLHLYERQTESMIYGKEIHDDAIVSPLIPKYKVKNVLKNVKIKSKRLKLTAKIDFILLTKFKEYIPVEIKWMSYQAKKPEFRHRAQLISASILIDENYKTLVKRAIIYYINDKRYLEFIITESDKRMVKNLLKKIWEIVYKEINPEIYQPINKCKNCGFKYFCKPYL